MDRIVHSTAVDIGGGRRGFRSKDTVAGVPGTVVTATHLNAEQEELMAVIEKSGLAGAAGDLAQVAKGIRSQRMNYVVAGGTANALTATLEPPIAANEELGPATPLRVKLGPVDNSGPATLSLNGRPVLPILTMRGQPLERGDLPASATVTLLATGVAFMLAGLTYSEFRRRLLGDLTLYCRPDGNDNNDGLANTSAGALRQPNRALQLLRQVYDVAGRAVTIRCADGTYAAPYAEGLTASSVLLLGNYGTPANVILDGATTDYPLTMIGASQLRVQGVTFAGTKEIAVSSASMLGIESCRLANGTGGRPKISATYGATVTLTGGNLALNNAASLLYAGPQASIISETGFITFTGNPAFGDSTVVANSGFVAVNGGFGGTATGRRYRGAQGGAIYTAGGGANFIPGDTAGALDATSSYA